MNFEDGLIFIYRQSWLFLRQLWWVVFLPILPILLWLGAWSIRETDGWSSQHIRLFYFAQEAAFSLAYLVVFYVLIRFLALGGDPRGALRVNIASMRTFAPFAFAYLAAMSLWSVAPVAIDLIAPALIGVCNSLFALWMVSAPGGGTVISPVESIRRSYRRLLWSVVLQIVAGIPFAFLGMLAIASAAADGLAGWVAISVQLVAACLLSIINVCSIYVIALRAGLSVTRQT